METKAYRIGTHRTLKPEHTLERVQPLLKSIGISRVANITGLDRVGIPVYNAFRPQSRSISVSQGKGSEPLAARVSAIMESIEAFHAETITQTIRFGSIHTLQQTLRLVDTSAMAQAGHKPLAETESIQWIEGHSLFDHQACWLPYEAVSTDYRLPYPAGSGYFAANTNGLASGNSLQEAICHAIYEVIERDAETLWNQLPAHRQAMTGVNPDSITDANCRYLIERFQQANIDVKIWDISSDIRLPVFTCLAMGDENDWADPEFGSGCHPCKEIALARALSEAAQARTTFIAGSRDDIGLSEYRTRQRQQRRFSGEKQRQAHQPEKDFSQLRNYDLPYIEDDLKLCLKHLADIGISQAIAVDLSKPEFGLAVVKVVIPGLEGASGHGNSIYVPGNRAREYLKLPFDFYGG